MSPKIKWIIGLVVLALLAIFVRWVINDSERVEQKNAVRTQDMLAHPDSLGEGVWYFRVPGYTDANELQKEPRFGSALSNFKAAHPELRVTAIALQTRHNGWTAGYWVNTESR